MLKCTTVKENVECPFMADSGCSFEGGVCKPVVEACDGCSRVAEYPAGWYCTAAPDPAAKWKHGRCNLATHVVDESVGAKEKINPLKASKRGRR
ncbi:MAG: PxxKW family cysteine-rich protein [Thermodesulfobacteriota bacterium]|nr:PxxKW family cysteine-rich protein [Thermodesulfobacteriota bacterium]